ncbi:hypothetical protein PSA01_01750 [Pseudonocardia saturnea]|uniref:Uncharacterized protein n=1 Tax=Pseudonocardia saturnea TaxID=33909 RepID=A0ABQ0RR64_9PSEU|nr:hypothetical protein Pdca_31910 [Pseudonocardia autotrophica]GEC23146.1 hypothetical protein PSA01_01750 [Pseudonocardia saturnea]
MSAATALSPSWGDVAVSDKAVAPVLASASEDAAVGGGAMVGGEHFPASRTPPRTGPVRVRRTATRTAWWHRRHPRRRTPYCGRRACGFADRRGSGPGRPTREYPGGPHRMPPVNIDAL